jgi:hypothetical protein
MKNLLREEISQIKYLFNYDRGKILSEQIDPEKKKEYLKKMEIAKGKNYMFETLYFDYLSQDKDVTALNNRIDQKKIEEINNEYIKSNPTNTQTADTPTLPKAEPTTDLGNVPKDTWEQMQETANTKPNYYTGVGESMDRNSAKSKSLTNAQLNASKKLNKTETNLTTKEINGLLSQKGDGNYVYRALYYITQV